MTPKPNENVLLQHFPNPVSPMALLRRDEYYICNNKPDYSPKLTLFKLKCPNSNTACRLGAVKFILFLFY